MTTSVRYFVQYLNSVNNWVPSNTRYSLTAEEAFAYLAQVQAQLPKSVMRVIKSTQTDGLINQEVIVAA